MNSEDWLRSLKIKQVLFIRLHYLCSVKRNKETKTRKNMEKKYYCTVCDWVYDPEVGDPDSGIAPGTRFEDIPDDWACPICGVTKEDFEIVEE